MPVKLKTAEQIVKFLEHAGTMYAYLAAEESLELLLTSLRDQAIGVIEESGLVFSSALQVSPFAAQVLPHCQLVHAESVSGWAKLLVGAAAEHEESALAIHVFSIGEGVTRRAALVESEFVALVRKKRRSVLKKLDDAESALRAGSDVTVIQLALIGQNSGVLSVSRANGIWPSIFLKGVAEIERDIRPPSRAYQKLLEALKLLGAKIHPGERCVDLGAAPGSWTYVALDQGGTVLAVDRSELTADLMAHPRLEFFQGDALKYEPQVPVDWLLCDVICEPARSIEVVKRWNERGFCRNFVVTLKFKGKPSLSVLEEAQQLVTACGPRHLVRRLAHNKNEVTLAAIREDLLDGSPREL